MVLVIGALESRGVEAGRDVGREGTAAGRLSAIAPNTRPTASATIHGPHRAEGRDADVRVGEERLDASAGVDGIEAFYERCVTNDVTIIKPLTATEWGTKGFYVEDPDGYLIGFSGRPATD